MQDPRPVAHASAKRPVEPGRRQPVGPAQPSDPIGDSPSDPRSRRPLVSTTSTIAVAAAAEVTLCAAVISTGMETTIFRQALAPPPKLAPPLTDVPPGRVMATGDIRNPRGLHTHLRQDRPLLRIRPAATPFDARQNLLSHKPTRHRRRRY